MPGGGDAPGRDAPVPRGREAGGSASDRCLECVTLLASVKREQRLGFERGAAPDPEGEMCCITI